MKEETAVLLFIGCLQSLAGYAVFRTLGGMHMVTFCVILALLALSGTFYAGSRYGRNVEAKAQAARDSFKSLLSQGQIIVSDIKKDL